MSEENAADDEAEAAGQSSPTRRAIASDLGGLAVFGSAVGYALGYAGQDSFFGAFGLTPDQVGIDKLTGLLRFTPLAVLFGLGLPFLFILVVCVGSMLDLHRPRWWPAGLPIALIVPVLAVLVLVLISFFVKLPSDPVFDAGRSILACWIVVSGVWLLVSMSGHARMAPYAAATAAVIVGMFALYIWMPTGATTLRDTGMLRERLNLIGIRSGYVDVRWHDPKRQPPELKANPPSRVIAPPPQTALPRLLVVLNQSGGTFTLWDCVARRIYTVHDADAEVVRILPARVDSPVIAGWTGCTG